MDPNGDSMKPNEDQMGDPNGRTNTQMEMDTQMNPNKDINGNSN